MSRVGVKTLLTWHKTKTLIKNPKDITEYPDCYVWKHCGNLCVILSKYCYVIDYSFPPARKIRLTQNPWLLELTYWYDGSSKFFTIRYNDPDWLPFYIPDMAIPLFQIPVTDIFTMFPVIVNTIQTIKITPNH